MGLERAVKEQINLSSALQTECAYKTANSSYYGLSALQTLSHLILMKSYKTETIITLLYRRENWGLKE